MFCCSRTVQALHGTAGDMQPTLVSPSTARLWSSSTAASAGRLSRPCVLAGAALCIRGISGSASAAQPKRWQRAARAGHACRRSLPAGEVCEGGGQAMTREDRAASLSPPAQPLRPPLRPPLKRPNSPCAHLAPPAARSAPPALRRPAGAGSRAGWPRRPPTPPAAASPCACSPRRRERGLASAPRLPRSAPLPRRAAAARRSLPPRPGPEGGAAAAACGPSWARVQRRAARAPTAAGTGRGSKLVGSAGHPLDLTLPTAFARLFRNAAQPAMHWFT